MQVSKTPVSTLWARNATCSVLQRPRSAERHEDLHISCCDCGLIRHAMLWACLPHANKASVGHKRPTCQHQRRPNLSQIPSNLFLWHEHWRGWVEVPAESPVAECHSMMTAGL